MRRWLYLLPLLMAIGFGCSGFNPFEEEERRGYVVIREPPSSYAWGEPRDGLRLGIAMLIPDRSKPPIFWVALQNVGDKDFTLNLGVVMNGKFKYTSAVKLIFTNSKGKSLELENNLGGKGWMGGRIDPLFLPFPRGSSHIVTVDLDSYWFTPSLSSTIPEGKYRIKALFEGLSPEPPPSALLPGMIPSLPYWKGVVESGEIGLEVIHRFLRADEYRLTSRR
jgi:hypothetical protein